MLERRNEVRLRIAVRVNVSGIDARCEGFSESVVATNLSRSGALLTGVQAELRCGDRIAVEYGSRTGHFRIVWVIDRGRPEGTQVAIHKLAAEECPWDAVLPVEEAIEQSD